MTDKIKAAVLTSGRQDYGILRSTLKLLNDDPEFDLLLLVGGMHLSQKYGKTVNLIIEDDLPITKCIDWLKDDQDELTIHAQTGIVIQKVGQILDEIQPDFLMLVGDRYETIGAALAATYSGIPIVHLHGGEETLGAIDNQLRHAITKLSHLHFVSHPNHAKRVIQMGERPENVHVVGAPGLDNLFRDDLLGKPSLEKVFSIEMSPPVVIVTLHPVTAKPNETTKVLSALIKAMGSIDGTYIITLPNADPGNQEIREEIRFWAHDKDRVIAVEAIGEKAYFSLMKIADAMIGNSSSGIIEAGVYQLPVVDIGSRQQGRAFGENIIHTSASCNDVRRALERAISEEFRSMLKGTTSLFGDGRSCFRIIRVLKHWAIPKTISKDFVQYE